ncbi:MAG TPA: DUF192 domain-containing protein [Nitrososphaera sp.]|jgi:hypothetical protein|nr:DUF192 domain-containing protein [Nitrososphaera sp.]
MTIIAIAAAAAAGIIALVIMTYVPVSRTVAEGDPSQVQNVTQPVLVDDTATGGYKKINITVNGVPLVADLAITGEQRTKGLAVKDSLAENESMLFYFPKANEYAFWMKDMKFPIDIIWLDTDRKVIHIEYSLEPCDSDACPLYKPEGKTQYVLETVAGFAQKYNVIEGTVVEFDPSQII